MSEWKTRNGYEMAVEATLPGVWRCREGGFYVRGNALDRRTKEIREVSARFPDLEDADDARAWLVEKLRQIREGASLPSRTKLGDFALSLLERKLKTGRIKSARGREKWENALEQHILPQFGQMYVDEIRRADIELWKSEIAERIGRRDPGAKLRVYSPHTLNTWLSILQVVINTAVNEFELARNPIAGIEPFDVSEFPSYTEESPNALKPEDVPQFLEVMARSFPQHFAMTSLGFATGLRPSSLRPLRRKGPTPDVLWDDGVLLVRRSHTLGDVVMETTKTKRRQRIGLPKDLMDILRWHVRLLEAVDEDAEDDDPAILNDEGDVLFHPMMAKSQLLFPSETGGFRARNVLEKPFVAVGKAIGLKYRVTTKAMRRTFQDLQRAAEIRDVVTRSISGHATEAMQQHYSTVWLDEQRAGLAKVIEMAGFTAAWKKAGK